MAPAIALNVGKLHPTTINFWAKFKCDFFCSLCIDHASVLAKPSYQNERNASGLRRTQERIACCNLRGISLWKKDGNNQNRKSIRTIKSLF